MCGIAGGLFRASANAALSSVVSMTGALTHRGPDDHGYWHDEAIGIALGHRRLAVVELTREGRQPMISPSGRYVIVFNGEIYNHLALREELGRSRQLHSWRGKSDTETLLACIESWGLQRTLERAIGMFAFGLWDRETRKLSLVRDRFGEKPLFYGIHGGNLIFGSELKSLVKFDGFERRLDRGALALFLRYGYIPGPYSIWAGIHKLPPGTFVTASLDLTVSSPVAYWSFSKTAELGESDPVFLSDGEATEALDGVLRLAVRGQMAADVPLGALLSGGVDSSTIASLMQDLSSRPIKTFCIGFEESEFDESEHAYEVARHLGTEHTQMRITSSDVRALVPKMASVYDEPFADPSQLPTCLVMSLARQHVTVALSGDAADELFGGYARYFAIPRLWSSFAWMGQSGRLIAADGLLRLSRSLDVPLTGKSGFGSSVTDKLQKLFERLEGVRTRDEFYCAVLTEWGNAEDVVRAAPRIPTLLSTPMFWPELSNKFHRMMGIDTLTYLPDDILVKVDRAAMAVSLETRAPFLDHRVAEFAWRLPINQKIRGGEGKWLLRQVLSRYVPNALVDRPKKGFSVPLNSWLRGPLKSWGEELLSPKKLESQGIFEIQPIRLAWEDHISGRRQLGRRLWSILMFQSWLEEQGNVT